MKVRTKLPRAVWALGFVSLLMDTSSEIVHGLLPVFLVSVLGASYTAVGAIEGAGEATSLVVKVFSGPLSDWWGRRKPLVVLGYAMGALSKPFFALAPTTGFVLGARLFDRTGKGIRGAPRDALVADATPKEQRGEAFGLRQSLDTVGAFLGPLLAVALMWLTSNNYRLIFWLAVIPGIAAVTVILFGVSEPEARGEGERRRISWRSLREFRFPFWLVAVAAAVFQLSRFSEAFLILRAQNLGLALALAPLVLVTMNIVYAATSYPVGWLSDRMRREWFVVIGVLILVVADLVLAYAPKLSIAFAGIALWGLHMGFTQGVFSALVVDTSPEELKGTAFGLFNLLSALALLLASGIAGYVWDTHGPAATFILSSVFSVVGLVALLLAAVAFRAGRIPSKKM
ncbi:MAG: MFS transporter [Bdellovibrionota bacterium]